jgi:hypothetical protein
VVSVDGTISIKLSVLPRRRHACARRCERAVARLPGDIWNCRQKVKLSKSLAD